MKLLLFALFVAHVSAHGYMSNPQPRARTIPGHRFQYEPQSDGMARGECQDGGRTGPITATWEQGSIIEIEATITANHQGWVELRICPDPFGGNQCFMQNMARALPPSSIQPGQTPPGSTDQPLGPAEFRSDILGGRSQWQLPSNVTCDHCAVQWWWITNNYGSEHFKSCHDVRIVSNGGAPPPPPPPPPPTTQPNPNPTPTDTPQPGDGCVRPDGSCGAQNECDGLPGLCDGAGPGPCCSPFGFCGNSPAHCTCVGCVDHSFCDNCAPGSFGACQHETDGNNTCFQKLPDGTCPAGTNDCEEKSMQQKYKEIENVKIFGRRNV